MTISSDQFWTMSDEYQIQHLRPYTVNSCVVLLCKYSTLKETVYMYILSGIDSWYVTHAVAPSLCEGLVWPRHLPPACVHWWTATNFKVIHWGLFISFICSSNVCTRIHLPVCLVGWSTLLGQWNLIAWSPFPSMQALPQVGGYYWLQWLHYSFG